MFVCHCPMTLFLEIHPQEVIKDVQQDLSTGYLLPLFILVLVENSKQTKPNSNVLTREKW